MSRYADVSSHLLSLRQPLIDFLLCVLREPAAPLQHAALNALEFMLDAVGCRYVDTRSWLGNLQLTYCCGL